MIIDEDHIDPIVIKRLLDEGKHIHSSAAGRVGEIKSVDNNGAVTIFSKSRMEHFVTWFHKGDFVEIKQRDTNHFVVVNLVREIPQVDLFLQETEADRRFREFDERNPAVFNELVRLTYELKNAGHNKIGIQMLFEVIRWKSMLETKDDDFKMNNNYAGRYARKIMSKFPDLDQMFETRGLRS